MHSSSALPGCGVASLPGADASTVTAISKDATDDTAAQTESEETKKSNTDGRVGQQVARLTASNTALLAELVDLQVRSCAHHTGSSNCILDLRLI